MLWVYPGRQSIKRQQQKSIHRNRCGTGGAFWRMAEENVVSWDTDGKARGIGEEVAIVFPGGDPQRLQPSNATLRFFSLALLLPFLSDAHSPSPSLCASPPSSHVVSRHSSCSSFLLFRSAKSKTSDPSVRPRLSRAKASRAVTPERFQRLECKLFLSDDSASFYPVSSSQTTIPRSYQAKRLLLCQTGRQASWLS